MLRFSTLACVLLARLALTAGCSNAGSAGLAGGAGYGNLDFANGTALVTAGKADSASATDGAAPTESTDAAAPDAPEAPQDAPGAESDAAATPDLNAAKKDVAALKDAPDVPAPPPDVAASPLDVQDPPESACPSGVMWQLGDLKSSFMHPGRACLDCHAGKKGAPLLTVAGTVFTGKHTVDDCNGASGVSVEITDANGAVHKVNSNLAGNFYLTGDVALPYTARVVQGGKSRDMLDPQTSGDCNSCHTQAGNNTAPGRIQAP